MTIGELGVERLVRKEVYGVFLVTNFLWGTHQVPPGHKKGQEGQLRFFRATWADLDLDLQLLTLHGPSGTTNFLVGEEVAPLSGGASYFGGAGFAENSNRKRHEASSSAKLNEKQWGPTKGDKRLTKVDSPNR